MRFDTAAVLYLQSEYRYVDDTGHFAISRLPASIKWPWAAPSFPFSLALYATSFTHDAAWLLVGYTTAYTARLTGPQKSCW